MTVAEPAKPALSSADAAVAQQIRALFETRASEAVPRKQDRAAVEAFYRKRDFAPLWVAASKALPNAGAASEFLRGVAADGLDPKDYPTPRFVDADPHTSAGSRVSMNELTEKTALPGPGGP